MWLSEIMLQQTTVKAVGPYYVRFLARWPDVRALAAAKLDDVLSAWAGPRLLRPRPQPARLRDRGGRAAWRRFPDSEQSLRALPGIGAYTAAAIAAIAFDRRAVAIDGNIERVIARLYAIETPLPAAKARSPRACRGAAARAAVRRFHAGADGPRRDDLHAEEAGMRHLSMDGACAARARGDAESLPRKAPKVEGKMRYGASFVVTRADGHVLVRTRPSKGLLGGMTEVPSTAWTHGLR